ncbi:hypothetical protein ACNE9Y_24880 [Pseudomonas sp. NY11226]|uniref:hypothetical protein n=1 Tax=Pseudomonas sp. NY11226 TaxID=3400362 RepID=UPI003A8C79F3
MSGDKPLMAALRDASWFARPNVRTPKRWHVLDDAGKPACGLVTILDDPMPAERVPVDCRCQRSGCRQRWQ